MTSERRRIVLVNGTERTLNDANQSSLLAWLHDDLGLTGTKYGCGEAACGACSVLVDGALSRACVVPVSDVVDCSVTTIEGLASDDGLHPVQRAFLEAGAMQCGFCTPGMIIAATALLDTQPVPSDDEIARWMAPNVCRCGAHPRIVEAVKRAYEPEQSDRVAAIHGSSQPELREPRAPWDLTGIEERDWFAVLGHGVVVVAPPTAASGAAAPTGGAWLHMAADGTVTAFTGKVEVGQGTRRALRILVAEELEVSLSDVRLVMGDTDVCPFDIGTFGSLSMPTAAADLRRAAAGAREELRRLGPITAASRRVAIVDATHEPRAATEWCLAGNEQRRGDVDAVTGAKRFASDLHRRGMRHGAVLRPPRIGARLRAVDTTGARRMHDVTVVVDGDFVGVTATTPDAAREAITAIAAEWEHTEAVAEPQLEAYLRAHPVTDGGWSGAYAHDVGAVDPALDAATIRFERHYTSAYLAHAPLETRVALAEWNDDRVTVWTGTQRPFGTRRALAEALQLDETQVRVIVPDTGTGFGGKHEPDTALAAARLALDARAPVRLQWTREEEFRWAYFRPAAVIDIRVGASSDGDLTAWEFTNVNSGSAGIGVPYGIAHQRLRFQPAESPLRQGAYRALASTANTFARESCVDEVARELRLDPLEFRLRNITDERVAAVLRAAASRFEWERGRDAGDGIGVAVGMEKGGRVATCALVQVEDELLKIRQIVTAFECGAIVDPDNLRRQIEGATIMGLGGALFEAVHFGDGRISNASFSQYRLPRFPDIPPIDVVLVDRPDLPSAGAGEAPIIAIAPALANAIFDATGQRIRHMPLLDHSQLTYG